MNFGLLKHPINWATVFLMLLLAGVGGSLLLRLAGYSHSAAGDRNPAVILKPADANASAIE